MTASPSADLAVTVARLWTKSGVAWAVAAVIVFEEQGSETGLMRGVLQTALVDAPYDFENALSEAAAQRLSESAQYELMALFEEVAGGTTEERPASPRQLGQPSR